MGTHASVDAGRAGKTEGLTPPASSPASVAATGAHVVVLAAGRGRRLGALGDAMPKWLLEVGGRTLADRHLEGIRRAGDAVASVSAVVGHAAGAIELALAGRSERVGIVANPEFAELNNWWSLLRALRELPDDGPVVVVNADLLADPDCLAAFVREAVEASSDGLLAVDVEREVTDESMKVSTTAAGVLERIGKVGVEDPVGEYVGMLMARGEALRALREELEAFVGRPDASDEWYERAVGHAAARGVAWHVWPMPTGAWVEIDDDGDLDLAESLVGAR